jgi:hypothetical protein
VIFKNGCWWTKSSSLIAVAALYYFLEMQSNHFLQTASYMEPFTSSKVELIMSAWKERNEAKFIMKWNEEKFIYIFKCYTTYATFKQNITHSICVCCHRRNLFILWFNSNHINDPWFECFRIMFLFRLNKTTNHKPDLGKKKRDPHQPLILKLSIYLVIIIEKFANL